ncbi:hypothetical protein CHU98_g9995 [Xylaria longipes]|nr:hypothetical protein CHU98_g9995 [Xylaria longipes]
MRSGHAIVALGALAHTTQAIFVASNSPCSMNCGNVNTATPVDQIVCHDTDYSSANGKVFQSCVTCESTSQYVTDNGSRAQSDLQAMLSCGRLKMALEYGNLSADATPYGYCSLWSDFDLDKCTSCLLADGKSYIRNCACQLQLQPPQTIPLTGAIFSNDMVNVTNPTNTATPKLHNNIGPLSSGALAGIVIGGVVFLLILLGCGIVLNGKRRRKNYLRRREEQTKNWPSPPTAGGEMFETPLSQQPLRGGWGDSPVSAGTTEGTYPYPRYFSPYATQFDSPVSAVDSHGQMAWPVEKAQSIGVALSPNHDNTESPWSDRKGKERADDSANGFELQEGVNSAGGYGFQVPPPPAIPFEAPVLNHPGYGRQGQANPSRRTPSPLE